VKKVIFAASSSVYGDTPTLPKHEQMRPSPVSPYAVSKYAGELYCENFSRLYGLSTVGLRYFNVFGPSQDPQSEYAAVIPCFVCRMLAGQRPIVYGDGEQSRDFTFVEDVVSANLLAARAPASGVTVNIGCGERFTLNQLVKELNKMLRTCLEPVYEPARPGDPRHTLADVSLAKETIGFEPQVSFREGLLRTVQWFEKGTHCGQPGEV
jgi:UDP-glucose 4-epimerase